MDLASRKYKFIEQFMTLVNEKQISKLEYFFKNEILEDEIVDEEELSNVLKEVLDKSTEDSNNGRLKSNEEVMSAIKAKYNFA